MAKQRRPAPKQKKKGAIYRPVFEKVFFDRFRAGKTQIDFTRSDIDDAAIFLKLDPKNLGDLVYSYRYRAKLPESIRDLAPRGHVWIIRGIGDAKYRLVAVPQDYAFIRPRSGMELIPIPDATPGIITRYARNEEQALLAKLRYNRLIDIFLSLTCYSLQSHLRTKLSGVGQVETDELYIGIDDSGEHFSIPVQAKGGRDAHSIVQIEQDFELCTSASPFDQTTCIPVAAQFTSTDTIALFSFGRDKQGWPRITDERHYQLVPEPPQSR